jgi:hypothetical protein
MTVLRASCFVVLAALLSCGGGSEVDGIDATIEMVSGDSQGVALSASSGPLTVRVLDLDSVPMAGIPVVFEVAVGPGSVTPLMDTTDLDGEASAAYTATTASGVRKIIAEIPVIGGPGVVFTLLVDPGTPAALTVFAGNEQGANASTALPLQLAAKVADGFANPVAGVFVRWSIRSGGGTLSVDSSVTDGAGIARVTRTLGTDAGGQEVWATVTDVADTLLFHATAKKAMTVLAGGENVPDRCASDLWVQGSYGYTGTWGNCGGVGSHMLNIWNVSSGVVLVDSLSVGAGTLSDNEVSADGALLLATSEGGGAANGLYIYTLADPAHPALVAFEQVTTGLHTGTFADIGGQRYVFASKDPSSPALMVFRIQPDSTDRIVLVSSVAQPANYGIHDQYLRDGLAFVSVWNTGLRIYDVGDGRAGGSPAAPAHVATIVTEASGLSCSCVHNAWWYHDTAGGKRYVFVGQEGPSNFTTASGDIHVVDVSNMSDPAEVAFYHLANAGVHNFWMDETRGILYAAYYNGGVVALDVTGTLQGNLASREIARITPGGETNTFTWGVMLANGALYASDMFSGFWKLSVP